MNLTLSIEFSFGKMSALEEFAREFLDKKELELSKYHLLQFGLKLHIILLSLRSACCKMYFRNKHARYLFIKKGFFASTRLTAYGTCWNSESARVGFMATL